MMIVFQYMVEVVTTLYMKVLKSLASGWYRMCSSSYIISKVLEYKELNRGISDLDLVFFRKILNISFTRPSTHSCL